MEPRNQKYDDMADMLVKVMEQALVLSRTADSAMASLESTTQKFDEKANLAVNQIGNVALNLPNEISQAMSGQLGMAAKRAADVMVEKWADANLAAANAVKTFNQAALGSQEATRLAVANSQRNFAWIFLGGLLSGTLITMVALVAVQRWM